MNENRENAKVVLQDAYKRFTADQDKIMTPDETVRRFKERLQTIDLDILEDTTRIDNGRLGIPVFFSTCGEDAAVLTGTKKQMGKGATPEQSEASAVMELGERFSFFSFKNNPANFVYDTYANLNGQAMGFEQIARSVHDQSTDLDIAGRIFSELPMHWTWGYNLTRQERVLIPFDWFFAINEFNGPSAGNCQEEALLQGICEIVERHVSSLISHGQLVTPGIRPDSATDPAVVEMTAKYMRTGIKFYLSDFTLDMGIPSVGMLAYDPTTFPEKSEIVWTAGTTPDPQKALSRTMTEVAQLAGDFNSGANYVASGLPKYTRLEDAGYIMEPSDWVDINDLPDISDENIRIEVQNCIEALEARQKDVFVINTMHPQLKIPAFYTIVPGAHFRERAVNTSVGMFCSKLVLEQNAPEVAVMRLKEIDKKLPGKYYVNFYLGSALLSSGQPEAAMPYFEQSLDLEPHEQDIPSIYSYTGVCLKELGKYNEALAVLEKGVGYDNERTDLFNLMGFCHFKLGEHEAAIADFKRVLALDPSSAIDYANIASNYRDMGDRGKAIEYYQMALTLDPSIDFAKDNLAKLLES